MSRGDALTTGAAPWEEFFITVGLGELPSIGGVLFSGGVSEYIYSREAQAFGDLGPELGRAIRREGSGSQGTGLRHRHRHLEGNRGAG